MSLALLTDRNAVLLAIAEFDELGQDAFLKKYGYGRADRYFLEHSGRRYDSKAIVGVAVGKQHPERGPLAASEFSGGDRTVKPKLEELGFTVVAAGFDELRRRWEAGGPWTDKQAEWRVARTKDVPELRRIMGRFQDGETSAAEFRFDVDSFAKHTKLAGFGGTSGLMFFNLLVKAAPEPNVAEALRAALPAPADDTDCRVRFDQFLAFAEAAGVNAKARGGTAPSLGYVPYFLSFFWEAQDLDRWPIYYFASRNTLIRYGLFLDKGPLPERYLQFRDRMDRLRAELGGDTWEIEAFLWTLDAEATAEKQQRAPDSPTPAPGPPEVDDFYEALQLRELIFPDELVTSLVLSLMAKPFVLLSGISGTGKTQLAVQLAEYLERHGSSQQIEVKPPEDDDSNIYIRLTESRLSLGRTNLTRSHQQALALHGGLPDRGTFKEYGVTVADGPTAQLRLNNIGFTEPGRELFLLFFRKPLDEWLRANGRPGDYLHLRLDEGAAIAAAELVSPELETITPSRHAVVAVKSDWTDPRGLLGYRNPITGEYVETDALRLLVRASATPSDPFILILDEMNLARVEYYFSDFLSAMELEGGEISLYAERSEEDVITEVPPRVQLPTNVLVVGTVNIDETTFTFSPKVLDRANVLTFNEVDVQRFFAGGGEELASTFRLKSGAPDPSALARRNGNAMALERARSYQPFSQALTELFDLLESEGRHFGYRVLTEITTFVGLALELVEGDEDSVWSTAFDLQITQKILPKLTGGRELDSLLERLLAFCGPSSHSESAGGKPGSDEGFEQSDDQELSVDPATVPATPASAPAYPRAAKTLSTMLKRLRLTGFVSFFE